MNNFSFKELYDVSLKTTYPIELDGRIFEAGETVAVFDKIQLATLDEKKNFAIAEGGYDNRALIIWEDTKELSLRFTQGVFSKALFALMTNAALIQKEEKLPIKINIRESIEADSERRAITKKRICEPIFVYDGKTGEKIVNPIIGTQHVLTPEPYQEIIVDYWYEYTNKFSTMTIGRSLTNGYLSLTGKTRLKDDTTGQVTTGIIQIPKLKLLSDLSMRLGQDAVPMVGQLDAIALPTGDRGCKKVMEIIFLNEDIDSDI